MKTKKRLRQVESLPEGVHNTNVTVVSGLERKDMCYFMGHFEGYDDERDDYEDLADAEEDSRDFKVAVDKKTKMGKLR